MKKYNYYLKKFLFIKNEIKDLKIYKKYLNFDKYDKIYILFIRIEILIYKLYFQSSFIK